MGTGTVNDNSSEMETEHKKRSKWIILVSIVIVVAVVIALFGYVLVNGGILGGTQNEWYFKGAYANYEGSASFLSFSFDFSMRLEIVDLNSTHLKTLYDVEMGAGLLGSLFHEQNTTWVPKEKINTITWADIDSYSLIDTYEDQVYLKGIGTKDCEVYVFSSNDNEMAMNVTLYVDQQTSWPIKFSVNMNADDIGLNLEDTGLDLLDTDIFFEVNLVDTNIPELT